MSNFNDNIDHYLKITEKIKIYMKDNNEYELFDNNLYLSLIEEYINIIDKCRSSLMNDESIDNKDITWSNSVLDYHIIFITSFIEYGIHKNIPPQHISHIISNKIMSLEEKKCSDILINILERNEDKKEISDYLKKFVIDILSNDKSKEQYYELEQYNLDEDGVLEGYYSNDDTLGNEEDESDDEENNVKFIQKRNNDSDEEIDIGIKIDMFSGNNKKGDY
jgi:hypothetical protein